MLYDNNSHIYTKTPFRIVLSLLSANTLSSPRVFCRISEMFSPLLTLGERSAPFKKKYFVNNFRPEHLKQSSHVCPFSSVKLYQGNILGKSFFDKRVMKKIPKNYVKTFKPDKNAIFFY